jgi:hypothetical protein
MLCDPWNVWGRCKTLGLNDGFLLIHIIDCETTYGRTPFPLFVFCLAYFGKPVAAGLVQQPGVADCIFFFFLENDRSTDAHGGSGPGHGPKGESPAISQ